MKEVRYTGVMMERKLTGSLLGDVTQDKHGGCVVHHWTVCCVYLFVFGMEHYRTGTTELWVAPHPEERACLLVALVWLTGAKSGPSRAALSESVNSIIFWPVYENKCIALWRQTLSIYFTTWCSVRKCLQTIRHLPCKPWAKQPHGGFYCRNHSVADFTQQPPASTHPLRNAHFP